MNSIDAAVDAHEAWLIRMQDETDAKAAIRHIRCAIAGQEVKADTWYTLNDLGEFEEVENV